MTQGVERLRRIPGWVWPLALGVLVFQPGSMNVGPDAAWYWALGKNLANGLGYVGSEWMPESRRGPGLPLLLAAAFRTFGEDVSSAAWVMRAAFIANALVTYALGARWFGRAVGVIAAFGLLTSPLSSSVGSLISVDVLGVTFGLLAVLALERGGWAGAAAAALAFAAAALTKEAVLVVALPLAVHAALRPDRMNRLAELAAAVAFAGFVLAAWSLWVGGAGLLIDRVASFLGSGGANGTFTLRNAVDGLTSFAIGTSLGSLFWPALLVGWGVVVFRAARGSSPDRLLVLLAATMVPVAILQGLYGLRAGQSYLLLPLSFLAFARAVQFAVDRFVPKYRSPALIASAVGVLAFFFAEWTPSYWMYTWLHGGSGDFEDRTRSPLSIPRGQPRTRGWMNSEVRDASAWLAENSKPDDVWVSDWYWADSIYVSSDGQRPLHRLPYLRSRDVAHMALETALPLPEVESYSPLLFVFSQANRIDPAHPDAWLNALSEPLLFARLEQVEADWLIVARRRLMIADYFDTNPSFELAHVGPGELVRIYRVRRPLRSTPFDTGLRGEVGPYLDSLAASDAAAYDVLVRDYFETLLGVRAEEVVEWRDLLRASAAAAGQELETEAD